MPEVLDAVVAVWSVADADVDTVDPGGCLEGVADDAVAADYVEVDVPVDEAAGEASGGDGGTE